MSKSAIPASNTSRIIMSVKSTVCGGMQAHLFVYWQVSALLRTLTATEMK